MGIDPSTNQHKTRNRLLRVLGSILLLATSFVMSGYLLIDMIPARANIEVFSCRDDLITIDLAIMRFFDDNARYPETFEEMVPRYLFEYPECSYGSYSLDFSGDPPFARCTRHGTYHDYHSYWGPEWMDVDWPYLALKIAIILVGLVGSIIFLYIGRKKRPDSVWGRYSIPATLWLGGMLIIAGTFIPAWIPVWDKYRVWYSVWYARPETALFLLAVSTMSILAGWLYISGRAGRTMLIVGLLFLLPLALNSVSLVYAMEHEAYGNFLPYAGSGVKGNGLGLYFMTTGVLVSLTALIVALLDKKKEKKGSCADVGRKPEWQ